MGDTSASFLRKQAWDYFSTHASQRISVFNFYVVLSSLITTTYFATFKADINLSPARPALSVLLSLFAFIFWKLDSRNKALIKNAERALKHFEEADEGPIIAKVFIQEEKETEMKRLKGWRRLLVWRAELSYSDCFNLVFISFFCLGIVGLLFPGSLHSDRLERKQNSLPPRILQTSGTRPSRRDMVITRSGASLATVDQKLVFWGALAGQNVSAQAAGGGQPWRIKDRRDVL